MGYGSLRLTRNCAPGRDDEDRKNHPSGKSVSSGKSCPAPARKIFRFPFGANHLHPLSRPAPSGGAARDRHETRGGMRWTRAVPKTRALACGRRSRVVLTPRRWRQVSREASFSGATVTTKPDRRGARRKPLKPLRGECRAFRRDRGDLLACFLFFARKAAGALSARHSLLPSDLKRVGIFQEQLGRDARREGGSVFVVSTVIPGCAAWRRPGMTNMATTTSPKIKRRAQGPPFRSNSSPGGGCPGRARLRPG
jgi:hypothetical protein